MHLVAAVIDEGALTFDLAIPCEVFGLDRSDIATPWYEFMVVAGQAQGGFVWIADNRSGVVYRIRA